MKTAILSIDINPHTPGYDYSQDVQRLEMEAQTLLRMYPSVLSLGLFSWVIPLDNCLPFFSELTASASKRKITFKTALLPQELEWISVPPADKA